MASNEILRIYITSKLRLSLSFSIFSSGHHSISQTNALCREQEGNGGLDRRSQIRPEMGNL